MKTPSCQDDQEGAGKDLWNNKEQTSVVGTRSPGFMVTSKSIIQLALVEPNNQAHPTS